MIGIRSDQHGKYIMLLYVTISQVRQEYCKEFDYEKLQQ